MVKRILNWISTAIVIIAVVLSILFVGVRLLGYRPFAILSPSMTPEYRVGDLIYVKGEEFENIGVGDVITCVVDDNLTTVTHRVVRVDAEEKCFFTKGDANDSEDTAPRYYENVVGVVKFSIPFIGYISMFFANPFGRYVTIAVVAAVILLVFLPDILKYLRKNPE